MKKERNPPKKPAYPLPPFKILHLERTACEGTCPDYTVCVDDLGEVHWKGRYCVKEEGERLWEISEAKVRLLNKLLTDYDFLHLDKNPDPMAIGPYHTCAPSCILTVVFKDGSRKKIDHYLGGNDCHPALKRLENRIDAILGVSQYVGSVFKS